MALLTAYLLLLRSLKPVAEILASKTDWGPLYDTAALGAGEHSMYPLLLTLLPTTLLGGKAVGSRVSSSLWSIATSQ